MNPSEEQEKVINLITQNKSVVVNSVAGAGKTTTLLFIAEKNKDKKILQITYNKQLKLEVRNKVKKTGIQNVEIHTYHSLAVKFYDPNCYTDDNIIKVLKNNVEIKTQSQIKYDIIVIDEVQDMTPNYYELIYKFMSDINFNSTMLILGDIYQGVYEFKNADTRYLTMSHKIWKNNNFEHLVLHQSYRVTHQIATFVNNIMLGDNRIISNKFGKKVCYYKKNIHFIAAELFGKIKYYFSQGYTAQDIFILCPTLKSENNPIKKLENIMVKNNIPVYFSRNDEEGIDENIISGKAVFTTFHQSKGRERKIVIVFGFDNTYFDFYAKEKPRDTCPSELYVAVTRASEILILIHHNQNEQLSFFKGEILNNEYIEYLEAKQINKQNNKINLFNMHKTTIKSITSFLSEMSMRKILPKIPHIFEKTKDANNIIDIPLNVKMKSGLVEDVSDLNSLVIPAIYEANITRENSSMHKVVEGFFMNETKENKSYIENKKRELMLNKQDPISVYLLLGNLYIAFTENILSKLNQIDRYDWLSKKIIKTCHKNIKNNIKDDAKYKQIITDENDNCVKINHKKYGLICISGRIDAYDSDTLWEIKCTTKITIEHLIQLIVCSWMWEKSMKSRLGEKKYKIINIRTNEVYELKYNNEIVEEIIELCFYNKYESRIKDSDIIFLEKCKKIRKQYD